MVQLQRFNFCSKLNHDFNAPCRSGEEDKQWGWVTAQLGQRGQVLLHLLKYSITSYHNVTLTVLDMRGSNPLSRSMKNKCKCGNEIHPVRIKYGYSNCVACSTIEKYGCAPVINHKTGNSIEILSRADAERIAKLTRRKGYGTMLR